MTQFTAPISTDGVPSPDQLVGLAALLAIEKTHFDIMVAIEIGGSPIKGDSARSFSDGKPRLDVEGYLWGATQRLDGSHRQPYTLYVLRKCDVASASILNALKNSSKQMKVTLGAYKAGGDGDPQPMLELIVDQARLVVHSLFTAPGRLGPCEVLGFAGKKFELKSAPQQHIGLPGPVASCQLEAAVQA